MSDITGKTIRNRYRVDSFVGRGGMAEVYKVWDNERGVHLAMKVLREDLAEDKLFMRRFAREAQTLAKLQHPNIVRFYGLEQDASLAFMVMDFVEGTTLRREIYNLSGPIEHERIMDVMRPACAALGYAHKIGVIHCDVKPGNIMLEQSGRVLIADFGIARLTDAATATMVGLGTPAYMAPELVRGKEPTPQSDVYSLGVILFEMLTGGERPFTGEQASITGSTSDKIRWEQATLDPPTPRRWNRELTGQQESVILKALDKDPAKRQSSTEDLYGDLDRVFGRSKGVVPREKLEEADRDQRVRTPEPDPESITGAVKTSDRTYRTKSKLWIAVIAVAIIGIGFTMLFGNQDGWWGDSVNGGDIDGGVVILEDTRTVVLNSPTAEIFEMGITPTPPSTKSPAMTPTTTPSLAVIPPKLGVGSTQVSDVDGMVMVYVPEGTFQRFVWSGGHEAGGDDINLFGFWIDQTEVTNAMFAEFINTEGNQSEGGNTWLDAGDDDVRIEKKGGEWYASFGWEDHPVVEITWYGAAAYCAWAGRRLPTITEWEKASRGEGGNLYPWGNAELTCNLANYKVLGNYSECRGETSKVGSYPDGASPYGALDTAGNVWEWVADWWWDPHYYGSSPTENPPGPSSGSLRMLQGGSWIWLPSRLLVWNTRTSIPAASYYDGGFRCASSP